MSDTENLTKIGIPRKAITQLYTFFPELPQGSDGEIVRAAIQSFLDQRKYQPCVPPHGGWGIPLFS